jgi:Mg-chelatase subunit ChlD
MYSGKPSPFSHTHLFRAYTFFLQFFRLQELNPMKRLSSFLLNRGMILFSLFVFLVMFSTRAWAGGGGITKGKLDVLVYFAYDEKDFNSWKPLFNAGSQLLFDATEKQIQLGTVTFTTCRQLKEKADIWVLNDTSGARAHLNGLGVDGRHVTISQTHKSTSGRARGQFGLVHEMGHYLFGILDEYKGYIGNVKGMDPKHYCVTSNSSVCCIMDGGTTITTNNLRTEFCTTGFGATKHFKGARNAAGKAIKNNQEYFQGKSCWKRIKDSGVGGLKEPATQPASTTAGHVAVTYKINNGPLAVTLVIDRSGSMRGSRMSLAILGSILGVGLMKDGSSLSVVSFSSRATVDLGMGTLNTGHRNAATSAISRLRASGSTAIGSGLLVGQGQLDRVDGCSELIILLSDGFSNSGPSPLSVVPGLKAKKTTVYSIGVGTGVDSRTMTLIATGTGGRYFGATSASQLPSIFQRIFGEVQGGGTANEQIQENLGSGQNKTMDFEVTGLSDSMTISLGTASTNLMDLKLKRPNGKLIDRNTVDPKIQFRGSSRQLIFEVAKPEAGKWQAIVSLGGSNLKAVYDLTAIVFSQSVSIVASTGSTVHSYPAPIPLSVAVTAGWPVAGARVEAQVFGPDDKPLPGKLPLFDDGLPAHGDQFPDDGVYSNLFYGYKRSGNHTFRVSIVNEKGRASDFTECPPSATGNYVTGGEEGAKPLPIPPFSQKTAISSTINGVPRALVAGALSLVPKTSKIDGQTVSQKALSQTPVLAFDLVGRNEAIKLSELQVALDFDKAVALGELTLHWDRDRDGKVDRPSVPLAKLDLSGSSGVVRFKALGGSDLLVLSPNKTYSFILAMGEAGFETGSLLPPLGGSRPGPGMPLPFWILALVLALLLVLRFASRRGEAGSWKPSPLPSWAMVAVLSLFLGLGSCGGGGGGGAPAQPSGPVNMSLTLGTKGILATGAPTGKAVVVSGKDFKARTRILR